MSWKMPPIPTGCFLQLSFIPGDDHKKSKQMTGTYVSFAYFFVSVDSIN